LRDCNLNNWRAPLSWLTLQNYRYDEAVTVARVLHPSLFDTLSTVPGSESTPPLYYLVAKLSTDVFGSRSAAAMRVPSALALTAAVPVAYLAFRRLIGERPALAAAAFVAVNPLLFSYSTDARSYGHAAAILSLALGLTGLLTFGFFSAARAVK